MFTPSQHHDTLFAVICASAPRLQECTLGAASPYDTLPLRGVPRGIFGGKAPLLQTLTFVGLSPDAGDLCPLPAFSYVPNVSFRYEGVMPKLLLRSHFPMLRSLGISWDATASPPGPQMPSLPLDCTGLKLQDLFVFDCQSNPFVPHLGRQLRLKDIPVIRMGMLWDCTSVMDDLCAPLALHALTSGEYSASFVCVTTRDGRRRIFTHTDWDYRRGYPLRTLRVLADHLTQIRLESDFIPGLIEFGVGLPVLIELRIDLSREETEFRRSERYALWPSSRRLFHEDDHGETYYIISCRSSKLERLIIFALDDEEQVLGVELRDLGLSLGQAERAKPASLVMVGVRFKDDIGQLDAFYAVFSEVIYNDFQGRTCPDSDYEEFWKYGFVSS